MYVLLILTVEKLIIQRQFKYKIIQILIIVK
jgi:hypothetical protein